MQLSPRYNFRYPELTDQISAFPPDVAAQNALLLDQIIGSLADNTTEALAGKAPTSHTHTMGQVTGLDTALAGKADKTTLDTRVPSTLALRLDTTVGTRVFAGNTMIYGDTGRRSVPELTTSFDFSASSVNGMFIRRVGNTVTLTATGKWISGQWITELLPTGFGFTYGEYTGARGFADVAGTMRVFGNLGSYARLNFTNPAPPSGATIALTASWHTNHSWPATLPGLPA